MIFYLKNIKKIGSYQAQYNEYTNRLGTKNYFERQTLENLLKIKFLVTGFFATNPVLKSLCLFALSAIIVLVSNTIRRADLRYKREHEKKYNSSDVLSLFIAKIKDILTDIEATKDFPLRKTDFVSLDAKKFLGQFGSKFDLVITSPPYVNGTNYFRNTKLELTLLDFINNIEEISQLKKEAVTSGINNVVSKERENIKIPLLQPIINELESCAYDKRIPVLVESYFSDLHYAFSNISEHLEPEAHFYLDIGDSQYAGVHVPTDQILIEVAKLNNFELIDNKYIRERFSKNGMPLKQVLLLFKKSSVTKKIYIKKTRSCNSPKQFQ